MSEETVGDNDGNEYGNEDACGFEAIVGVIGKFRLDKGEAIEAVIGIIEAEFGGQGSV